MTWPNENGPGTNTGPVQNSQPTSRPLHDVNQRERVLRLLLDRDAICGTEFLQLHLPRATARIFELRKAGYVIQRTQCDNSQHRHLNPQWQWSLVATPAPTQVTLWPSNT